VPDARRGPAGYPEYELRAGGADTAVGAHNVAEYVEAVAHATLREGIQAQLAAFRRARAPRPGPPPAWLRAHGAVAALPSATSCAYTLQRMQRARRAQGRLQRRVPARGAGGVP